MFCEKMKTYNSLPDMIKQYDNLVSLGSTSDMVVVMIWSEIISAYLNVYINFIRLAKFTKMVRDVICESSRLEKRLFPSMVTNRIPKNIDKHSARPFVSNATWLLPFENHQFSLV